MKNPSDEKLKEMRKNRDIVIIVKAAFGVEERHEGKLAIINIDKVRAHDFLSNFGGERYVLAMANGKHHCYAIVK